MQVNYLASFGDHRQGKAPAGTPFGGGRRDFGLHREVIEYRSGVGIDRIWRGPTAGEIAMQRLLASMLLPLFGSLLFCGAALAQAGGPTPSPAGAAVYFIGLKDGDTLLCGGFGAVG